MTGLFATPGWNELPFPTLTTARLTLREVTAADADDLFTFRSDAEAQQYNLIPLRDLREAHGLIRTMQGWYETRYAIQWGITQHQENRVLGLCGLHEWNRHLRRAFVGYDLVRTHWGRGIASEAMHEVVRFGFEEMELERLLATTIVENARSIRLLERLGFTLQATRRGDDRGYDPRSRASVIYGLSRGVYDQSFLNERPSQG